MGVPDVLVTGDDADLVAAGKTMADVVWNDLDFEREYYMIDRKRSATIPAADPDALPFQRWTDLGADFVLVLRIKKDGTNMDVAARMISVREASQGHQAFGEEYPNCTTANARACAHFIADDLHKQTRGLDGVARTQIAFATDRDATRVAGPAEPDVRRGQGNLHRRTMTARIPQRVTANHHLNISPAWSPVGRILAYTSVPDGFSGHLRVGLQPARARDSRGPAHGTDDIQNQLAAWSPDGSKIAFMSTRRAGNDDIWVVNRDGSGLHDLTNNPAADVAPTWSPDGNKIAFISDRGGTNQLYVMSADGTGQQKLLDQQIDRPTWSRLNFIAFTIGSGASWDIGIYDFNNPGPVKVLTDGLGKNESPSVSPNGRHIVFVTTRWGKEQLAIVDRTGGPDPPHHRGGQQRLSKLGSDPQVITRTASVRQ